MWGTGTGHAAKRRRALRVAGSLICTQVQTPRHPLLATLTVMGFLVGLASPITLSTSSLPSSTLRPQVLPIYQVSVLGDPAPLLSVSKTPSLWLLLCNALLR